MSEISTGKIVDGITLALRTAFPGCQIESDTVEQGLRPPAFLVLLVNTEVLDYPARRQKRLPRFDILYFPKAGREECYRVADTLCGSLAMITLRSGDLLRSSETSFEIEDGVLHFLVSYGHFTVCQDEKTHMETLDAEFGTKNI